MKIKFEPNEFEIGKEYHGKIIEITESQDQFFEAIGEPEVFAIIENEKCWIQTHTTAVKKGYDLSKRKSISLDELNQRFPTGKTIFWDESSQSFVEGEKPREIYFPSSESVCLAWRPELRGVISLASTMPSIEEAKKMFNIWLPFKTYTEFMEGFSKAGGECIFMHNKRDEKKFSIAGYLAVEEPLSKPSSKPIGDPSDGKESDKTDTIWGRINTLRRKTDKPIGILDNDIHFRIGTGEYERHLELYLACDFLMSELYPYHVAIYADTYRPDLPKEEKPKARMQESYNWIAAFSEKHSKPFIIVAQATYEGHPNLLYPNLREQYDFWCEERGLGIFWYKWDGAGTSIKQEFQTVVKELHSL